MLTVQPNLSATLPTEARISAARDKLIIISLKQKTLKFIDSGKLIKQYQIGIGKPKTPTPIGKGFVWSKGRMIFRNDDGDVIYSAKKMLGFGISIPGHDPFQYYIHSTVNNAAVNAAISKGCVRMKIPEMLKLYPLVPVGTRIIIKP